MATAAPSPTESLRRLWEQRVAVARDGVNSFCELVLKDEATGEPIRQADLHREWHRLVDLHPRLVLWAAVEHGKSMQLSVARTLFELGRDPTVRVAIVSNTHTQATKLIRTIAGYIEKSPELHAAFPHLRPASPWTDNAITVQRATMSKDFSVAGYGLHGAVLGSRIDLLILEDILDYESTRTEEQRRITYDWVMSTLLGRLTARGRVIVVGTAFDPNDLLHRLAGQGWPNYRFPAEKDGVPQWPARWSAKRIAEKRLELGPAEASRQLDVQARDDSTSRFKLAWIEIALRRGAGKTCLPHLLHTPYGCQVVTGVDVAVSKSAAADITAFVTLLVHANGDRQVLNIDSGRLSGPEIVDRVVEVYRRYGGIVVVESVAAQAFISHFLSALGGIAVTDFKTGRGKMSLDWQCEALAAEMARGQWVIPSDDGKKPNNPEVASFLRDLLYYTPDKHTPDRLAAACFARWGCEQTEARGEVGFVDTLSR